MDAFGLLVERYEAPIRRYIRSISSFTEKDAEDLTQEVFVKCWRNLQALRSDKPFRPWLYRIAHNETRSFFRKWKARGGAGLPLEDDVVGQVAGDIDIEADTEDERLSEQVRNAIKGLPSKYREVLLLRYMEDQSYEEIAAVLRKPPGTIATLLNRAKAHLKKALTTQV